jgi:hypothetical protein
LTNSPYSTAFARYRFVVNMKALSVKVPVPTDQF